MNESVSHVCTCDGISGVVAFPPVLPNTQLAVRDRTIALQQSVLSEHGLDGDTAYPGPAGVGQVRVACVGFGCMMHARFVLCSPDPRFVLCSPDSRFVLCSPDSRFVLCSPDSRFVLCSPDSLPPQYHQVHCILVRQPYSVLGWVVVVLVEVLGESLIWRSILRGATSVQAVSATGGSINVGY